MFLQWMVVVLMPLLTAACAPNVQQCDCNRIIGRRGCFIDQAAPKSFKWKCRLDEDSECFAEAIPCRRDEACPGGRYSYCACVQGGGECQGYSLRPSNVESCLAVNKVEASSSLMQYSYKDCECDYFSDHDYWGCRIVEAAPEGFKCACYYDSIWTCTGQSIGCDEDEHCPADDYTYCGCRRGNGNCNGYLPGDREDRVCDLDSTCDCNHSNGWTKDQYFVAEVEFNTDDMTRSNPWMVEIGHVIDLPNASEGTQKQEKTFVNTMTSEYSFERSHGMTLGLGIDFSAIVPISLTSQITQSFTYGSRNTTSSETRHSFTCESPPKTHTRCTVYLMKTDITVPYSMLMKHKVIPDCGCRSYGNLRSTTSSFSKTVANHIGPCNRIVSEECVAK